MTNDQPENLPPRPSLSIPFPLEIGEAHIAPPEERPESVTREPRKRPGDDRTIPGRGEDERSV